MSNVRALKILEGGLLEHAKVCKVDATTWADGLGRILTDSGRMEYARGWGRMDGGLRILVDEMGRDAYLIR